MMQQQGGPFFKPLNTDHHSFENSGKSQNRSRQAQNFNEARRQDQDFAVSGERLNSLHAKLHQEADKIRKWKNQTELDLKQKDRKIQESSQTIDSLRKSVLDIQLQNESLSMKLQEEMGNREDILQKVTATRNLCSILKDHLAKTEAKVAQCEAEKTEVKYLEQEHKREFEGLSEKLKTLQIARDKEHDDLSRRVSVLTKDKECLEQELKQSNQEAESKLKLLTQQLDEKDIEIRDIRAQVEKNNDKIHSLEKTIDSLKQELNLSREQLENAKIQHLELNKQLEVTKVDKDALEKKFCESTSTVQQLTEKYTDLQTDLNTVRQEHTQQLHDLHTELENHKLQLDQKHKKLQFLENDFDRANSFLEEVKSSKDMLIMEKAELQNRLVELEKQNAEILAQHEQDSMTMTQMTGTIQKLQAQLLNSQQDGANLLLQLNAIREQLSLAETEKLQLDEKMRVIESDMVSKKTSMTDIQRELLEKTELVTNLSQQIELLQETLQTEQTNHRNTQEEMKVSQKELDHTQKELAKKIKELEKLRNEQQDLETNNDTLVENLKQKERTEADFREEIDGLQSELTLLKENNESLLEERQQSDEALNGKLLSKEKTASDLETKNKSLKSDIASKNKHIKEIEKEMRSLKSKLTAENKALDGKDKELSKLHTELEKETSLKAELEVQINEKKAIVAKLEEELKSVGKSAKEAKELADKCLAEKDEMFNQCEAQRTEMSTIMLGYRTDLDKNLAWREKEVESLKQKMETMKTKHKKETEVKVAKLNCQIEQLRKTISDSGYQMESLQKNYSEKENKLQELEKENLQKDEELKGLQDELEKMYIKSTTTTEAQTSPYPDKTYKKQPGSKIPTPKQPPRTPQVNTSNSFANLKTPVQPRTPQFVRTPADLKTPQRSILKPLSGNSATKKRRVVFASKENDEQSESGESSSFEVMDIGNDNSGKKCITPLILKHSPKPVTPCNIIGSVKKNSPIPLSRTPRGPPVDLSKKKDKKEKTSSVRKAPNKSAGKFFKNSPKQRKDGKTSDMSWFENDDIFGFALED